MPEEEMPERTRTRTGARELVRRVGFFIGQVVAQGNIEEVKGAVKESLERLKLGNQEIEDVRKKIDEEVYHVAMLDLAQTLLEGFQEGLNTRLEPEPLKKQPRRRRKEKEREKIVF